MHVKREQRVPGGGGGSDGVGEGGNGGGGVERWQLWRRGAAFLILIIGDLFIAMGAATAATAIANTATAATATATATAIVAAVISSVVANAAAVVITIGIGMLARPPPNSPLGVLLGGFMKFTHKL